MKTGVIHGRFQVFHNGHLEYALQAKALCDYLIVGVTNPDPENYKFDEAHPSRSKETNNPFTYFERLCMIKASLLGIGLEAKDFDIVPFPINYPERLHYYIPQNAITFTRIYEPWNNKKSELLEKLGYKVDVLFKGEPEDKDHTFELPIGGIGKQQIVKACSGTKVRAIMLKGEEWQDYVPEGTVKIVRKHGLLQKLTQF